MTTHQDEVRIEPTDDPSKWRIERLQSDGSAATLVRRWTAEVLPDRSVISSLTNLAHCSEAPPRHYEIELRGKIRDKKRLRIELRGTDVSCPEMGCSFTVTHVFTRDSEDD